MTPKQIEAARRTLGLTLSQMAAMLGYEGAQMRQQANDLESGRRPVREPQRRLVEAYLSGYRPADWPLSAVDGDGRVRGTMEVVGSMTGRFPKK
jgi:transcriptional regulator with XRE-family HTH domain